MARSAMGKTGANTPTGAVTKTGKPPYPFRTGWALFLLAGNFLVAAYYFHLLK